MSDLINELEKFTVLRELGIQRIKGHDWYLGKCYSSSKEVQPFVHLPIQSELDKVLKLMKRGQKLKNILKSTKK